MVTFKSSTFIGQTVRLDHGSYESCDFKDCVIEYGGEGPISLIGCNFKNCNWQLVGPARNTVIFLKTMYESMGDFGKNMVDQTFNSIKSESKKVNP